jgi:hypothetical protein
MKRLTKKSLWAYVSRYPRDWSVGAPEDTLHLKQSTYSYRFSLGQRVYRCSLVRLLLSEMAGILGRIRAIRETQIYHRGVRFDPGRSTVSCLLERERIADACIADKDNLTKARSHLTLVDIEIFVQGWLHGHEWSVHNYGKQFLASTSLTDSRLAPESSKHDL